MQYEVKRLDAPVVEPGEYVFSVIGLEHGHIYGMTEGLLGAGATLKWVWDKDPRKVDAFCKKFPQGKHARGEEDILSDPEVRMVAAAAIPYDRCALGVRVMKSGKDYFTDKTPLTSLKQLEDARQSCAETGKRYFCYFSERLHVESAVYAGELIKNNAIGRVIQVLGMGPHRLSPAGRPPWFFSKSQYGGILCDIGSHQIEQFLYYAGVKDAEVSYSRIANYAHPEYPELEDFGDAMLVGDNGATNYFRVDWFTPDGLSTWGDGRTVILGTQGYIELRKYVNIGVDQTGDHVFLVDHAGEHHFAVNGAVGFPFFGEMIGDSLNGTEKAMTQEHIFKAAELCVQAEMKAEKILNLFFKH